MIDDPTTHPELETTSMPAKPPLWRRMGGGALSIAILIHVALVIAGGFWVFQIVREPEKKVDFMPGNGQAGGGERSAQYQMKQKRQSRIMPSTSVKRVFAEGATSNYAIPEPGDSFGDMSALSSMAGGGMSGGMGGSGGGKGFGSGIGDGLGKGLGTATLFGIEMQSAGKVAVVMDVSRSMTSYLPLVAKELDKLAAKGPLILYFGCGLAEPPKGKRIDDRIRLVESSAFDRFWTVCLGKTPLKSVIKSYDRVKYDKDEPIPLEPIYHQMKSRLDTYFLDFNGIQYTQPALTSKVLKDADTIYWFADFQDKADEEVMKDVLKHLKSHKQKLYLHSTIHGRSYETIRDHLAIPSGGSGVIKDIKTVARKGANKAVKKAPKK